LTVTTAPSPMAATASFALRILDIFYPPRAKLDITISNYLVINYGIALLKGQVCLSYPESTNCVVFSPLVAKFETAASTAAPDFQSSLRPSTRWAISNHMVIYFEYLIGVTRRESTL
jgi:hypothetical protein